MGGTEEKKDAKEINTESSSLSVSSSGDLLSTVEKVVSAQSSEETLNTETPEKEEKTTEEKETEEKEEKAKEETKEKEEKEKEEEPLRFDKHPRFQELIKRVKTAEERALKAEAQLEALMKGKEPEKEKELNFVDITTKTDEELLEWQQSDPKGYAANLARQIRYELQQEIPDINEILKKHRLDEEIERTYEEYAKTHPDFDEMWDAGEIQRYMEKHPGHTPISAHMMLTQEKREAEIQKRIEEAVAKAVKETEEKMIKQFKAKKHAKVLPAGPASTGILNETATPDLKDTKKFGGLLSVLVERSKQRERLRGG